MSAKGMKLRNSDKKGEKGEGEKYEGTKGYDDQNVRDMIQGLTTKIDNFMIDINIMKDDIRILSSDKLEIDDVDRVNVLLQDKIADVLQVATDAKNKASNLEKETEQIKKNSTSPYPSPLASHSTPSKSIHIGDKYILSAVQNLNTKEISNHLSTLKISDDSIQTMTLFYSTISMMVFVGTYGTVSLPIFDKIDEHFDFRNELVPKPNHPNYQHCMNHYNYMDKLLANKINVGINDTNIISNNAKETRIILNDYYMSTNGFEKSWAVISGLVPRLGNNNMNYDPMSLIKTLVVKNGGSYRKLYIQAKNIDHTLSWLKEDFGPHKLIMQFLVELSKTKNYYLAVMVILSKLRSFIRRHGDRKFNIFKYEGEVVTVKSLHEMIKMHRIQDKFILESSSVITPAINEIAINEIEIEDASDEEALESYKAFFKNFKKKESCPACGRYHGGDPDRCERRGEKFRPDWMNKRIRQYNLQHGDAPKKPQKFGPPQPMDSKVKKANLISKEAELEQDSEEVDQGDMELTNMLTCINTMDDDFLYSGSVEINDYDHEDNQEKTYEFIDDPDFITAPDLQQSS